MNNINPTDTLIGIDYGEENTGLALGRNSLVTPLEIISSANKELVAHKIIRFGMENNVTAYIMGLPLTADNKETGQSLKVRGFAKLLRALSKKPVIFQNEFGTTMESMKEAIETQVSPKNRRLNDDLSAALILKNFYSTQQELSKLV